MIAAIRARVSRWWELRLLRRERDAAYWRWRRAYHEYQDTAVIFGGDAGAWAGTGPAGRTQDAATDRAEEYRELAARVRRLEES